ncbi:MAG: hypothetical protein KAR21_10350 [Spirochaetales bacterium]|nr:hypothetical protein [Spirochaetales bacterium]
MVAKLDEPLYDYRMENPHYHDQRQKRLDGLSDGMIDVPIIEIVNGFSKLPFCFTLQSCFGHFLYNDQMDPYNLEPLPVTNNIAKVEPQLLTLLFVLKIVIQEEYSWRL